MEFNGEKNLFTWNDLIVIKPNAPSCYSPGKIAVICGIQQIKSEKLSNKFNVKIGDWLYTVTVLKNSFFAN